MSIIGSIKYWYTVHQLPLIPGPYLQVPSKEKVYSTQNDKTSTLYQKSIASSSVVKKNKGKKKTSVIQILTQFEKNLRLNPTFNSMIKPEGGSTGFTFICTSTGAKKTDRLKRFILKWDSEVAGKNQQLCSDLLSQSGFSAPKIRVVTEPIAGKLKKHAEKICHAFTRDDFTLIYMPSFPAITFSSAQRSGYLTDLTLKNWKNLFIQCGRIVVMDLVTGNADRFFRSDWTSKESVAKPHFNDGNVMLEMPYEQSMQKRVLKGIHFIDNATDPALTKCFQKSESDTFLDDDLCLEVGGSDVSTEPASGSEAEKSGSKKLVAITDKPSPESWKRTVKSLASDPSYFIPFVANGIVNSFKNEELPLQETEIRSLLQKGFKLEIQNIKACDLNAIERTIQIKISDADVCLNIFQLVMENLKIIREL